MRTSSRAFSSPLLARLSMSRSFVTRTLGRQSMHPSNASMAVVDVELTLDCFHFSNAGYCFVEFPTPESANKALQLNGTPVPNSTRQFKLNWASGGGLVDRR